jgi:hypothetical protein
MAVNKHAENMNTPRPAASIKYSGQCARSDLVKFCFSVLIVDVVGGGVNPLQRAFDRISGFCRIHMIILFK